MGVPRVSALKKDGMDAAGRPKDRRAGGTKEGIVVARRLERITV